MMPTRCLCRPCAFRILTWRSATTSSRGSPCVQGSRVPVRRLWSWHRRGVSVETLLKRYPALGPARVLDALAFAYDNTELIEADLRVRKRSSGRRRTPFPAR